MDKLVSIDNKRAKLTEQLEMLKLGSRNRLKLEAAVGTLQKIVTLMREYDPNAYSQHKQESLKVYLESMKEFLQIEIDTLRKPDVTDTGDILTHIDELETIVTDIDSYLAELAAQYPEQIEP